MSLGLLCKLLKRKSTRSATKLQEISLLFLCPKISPSTFLRSNPSLVLVVCNNLLIFHIFIFSPKECNPFFIITHFIKTYVIIIENSPRKGAGFLCCYEVWNAKTFHKLFFYQIAFLILFSLFLYVLFCFVLGGERHKIKAKIHICPYF